MRFSMIDVTKYQLELQKGAKKKLLILTNEVKTSHPLIKPSSCGKRSSCVQPKEISLMSIQRN